jgi:hypothetical protein
MCLQPRVLGERGAGLLRFIDWCQIVQCEEIDGDTREEQSDLAQFVSIGSSDEEAHA